MLKITETSRTHTGVELKAEGKITEETLEAVKTECENVLSNGFQLQLDMTDVSFVERSGLRFLKDLQNRRVRLVNCSLFLSRQLIEERK